MFAYLARTAPVIARAVARRDGRLVSTLSRRVPPRHLDLNLHMNQAAYAEVAEVGRTDWVIRSGAWARWRKAGVNPVVADQHLVYRRELRLGQAFRLDTRAVGVDGRLLRIETHLCVGDVVHAKVEVRLIFVGRSGRGVLGAEAVAPLCDGLVGSPLAVDGWRVT